MDQQDMLSSVYPSEFESSPEYITSTIASSSAYRATNSGTLYTSSTYSAVSQDDLRYKSSVWPNNEVLRYPQSAQRVSSNSTVADGSPYFEKQPLANKVLHHPSHEATNYYAAPYQSMHAAAHYTHSEDTGMSGYNDSLNQYHNKRLHDLNTRRHENQLESNAREMQHLSALRGNGSTSDTSGETSALPAASHSDVSVQGFKTQHLADPDEAPVQSHSDGSRTMSRSYSIPMCNLSHGHHCRNTPHLLSHDFLEQSGSQRQQDTQYHRKTSDHSTGFSRIDSFPQHDDQHARSDAGDVQFTKSVARRRSKSPQYSTVNEYTEGDDNATVNDDVIGMSGYDHTVVDTWPAPSPTCPGNDLGNYTGASSLKKKKKSKMHECTICHKKFPRPSGLKTHMNIHNNEKPFACGYLGCSRTFGVRSNAKRHMRTHGMYSIPSGSKASDSYVVGFDVPVIMPPQTDHVTGYPASGTRDTAPPPMHGQYNADGENSVYGAGEGEASADEGDTDSTSTVAATSGRPFKVRWMPLKEPYPFPPALPSGGMVSGAPMPAPGALYAHPESWQGSGEQDRGNKYAHEPGDTLGDARSAENMGRESGRRHAKMV